MYRDDNCINSVNNPRCESGDFCYPFDTAPFEVTYDISSVNPIVLKMAFQSSDNEIKLLEFPRAPLSQSKRGLPFRLHCSVIENYTHGYQLNMLRASLSILTWTTVPKEQRSW